MKHLPYLLIMCVIALWMPSWAQEIKLQATDNIVVASQTLAPLPPAPIPDSGKGWADFFTKKIPDFLVVATPIILMILRAGGAVAILERIPAKLVPLTSGVLAALMAALGATGADAALGSGGIDPAVAALEAGPLATAAHYGIRAVLKKKAEQKEIDNAVGQALT